MKNAKKLLVDPPITKKSKSAFRSGKNFMNTNSNSFFGGGGGLKIIVLGREFNLSHF